MHVFILIIVILFILFFYSKENKIPEKEKMLDDEHNNAQTQQFYQRFKPELHQISLGKLKRQLEILEKLEKNYAETKIPSSKWILMNRYEKSNFYEKREKMENEIEKQKSKVENLKALIKENR